MVSHAADFVGRICSHIFSANSPQVEKVALKVRGNDLGRLRGMIIELARIPDVDHVFRCKANRGWESPLTAEFLVPVRYLDQFRKDPAA